MPPKIRPSRSYENIMNVTCFCARLIGVDVIVPNYRMNYITGIVVLFFILYYSFSASTILKYLNVDRGGILEVICTMGSATTGLVKFSSGIYYARKYYNLNKTLMEIYRKYEKKGIRYEAALYESSKRLKKILRYVGVLYITIASSLIAVPLIMMWFKDKKYTMLYVYIPYLDLKTPYGYWITFAFHLACVAIAAFGLYAGDMYLLIFLTHALLFVDILRLKVEDINQLMSDAVDEDDELDENISEKLNDILSWHQAYFEFNDTCNYIFYWIVTVQIFLSASSILLTLFTMRIRDWPAAGAYLFYSFNTTYEYCILGSRIEICNDKFCEEIYNINWYNMDTSDQKTVRLMLMRSQSPKLIDVAGIMPLTVATALAITRSIYSIFMMMLQFY